jgi:hypothetical protein
MVANAVGARGGAVGLVAVAMAGAGALACRQIIGIPDTSQAEPDAGASACGLPYGSGGCAACVQASCCAESSACATDVPCAAYFQCLGACAIGDWTCRAQCELDHPIGTAAEFPGLTTCMTANCESPCGLTCGATFMNVAPDAAVACAACMSSGCAANRAYATSTVSIGWAQCVAACTTPDCRGACDVRYGYADAGSVAFAFQGPSFDGGCACAVTGSQWSCLGHVSWPGPTASPTTLTTEVVNYGTDQPVAGADVSICRFLDPTCSSPLGHGQTDSNGFVAVNVPAEAIGGLQVDTYAQITSLAIIPTLYFPGYPVSESVAPIAEPTRSWPVRKTPSCWPRSWRR